MREMSPIEHWLHGEGSVSRVGQADVEGWKIAPHPTTGAYQVFANNPGGMNNVQAEAKVRRLAERGSEFHRLALAALAAHYILRG
jgi:hypothetical protein